jgi:hypothetical protein
VIALTVKQESFDYIYKIPSRPPTHGKTQLVLLGSHAIIIYLAPSPFLFFFEWVSWGSRETREGVGRNLEGASGLQDHSISCSKSSSSPLESGGSGSDSTLLTLDPLDVLVGKVLGGYGFDESLATV